MSNHAVGGNDLIVGIDGRDELFGDARFGLGNALGGNDTLVGGDPGNDTLYGGHGADVYVFVPGDDTDSIRDFSQSEADLIDVRAFHFQSFQEIKITYGLEFTEVTLPSPAAEVKIILHSFFRDGELAGKLVETDFLL